MNRDFFKQEKVFKLSIRLEAKSRGLGAELVGIDICRRKDQVAVGPWRWTKLCQLQNPDNFIPPRSGCMCGDLFLTTGSEKGRLWGQGFHHLYRLKGRISEQKAESTVSAHVGSAMPGDICCPGASDTELVEPRPVITEDLRSLGPSRANYLNLVLVIDPWYLCHYFWVTGRFLHPFYFCKLIEVSALFAEKKKCPLLGALGHLSAHHLQPKACVLVLFTCLLWNINTLFWIWKIPGGPKVKKKKN